MQWRKTNFPQRRCALKVSLCAVSVAFVALWVRVIFPQYQADIIFMLPLIALGAIELLWLKISLVCKRVFQWMWYFQTEPKSMTQKG